MERFQLITKIRIVSRALDVEMTGISNSNANKVYELALELEGLLAELRKTIA